MQVKFKKLHPDAIIPSYATPGDAGLDLTATSIVFKDDEQICYGTGLAVEIPEGHVGLLFPRSSIRKYSISLSNSVGVIDSGYRGEIQATFNFKYLKDKHAFGYSIGERIVQLLIIPYPSIETVEVQELSSTQRGEGGFGSTGK